MKSPSKDIRNVRPLQGGASDWFAITLILVSLLRDSGIIWREVNPVKSYEEYSMMYNCTQTLLDSIQSLHASYVVLFVDSCFI